VSLVTFAIDVVGVSGVVVVATLVVAVATEVVGTAMEVVVTGETVVVEIAVVVGVSVVVEATVAVGKSDVLVGVSVSEAPPQAEANKSKQTTTPTFFMPVFCHKTYGLFTLGLPWTGTP